MFIVYALIFIFLNSQFPKLNMLVHFKFLLPFVNTLNL
jgi:hypothetical protein